MPIIELDELGQEIFETRYAYPGEKTWRDRSHVIANTVATAEREEDIEYARRLFFGIISTGDFIPGGRIIYGSGRGDHNLLNCYFIQPEDNINSIGKTLQDMYKISCTGGGLGFNLDKIRPKGDHIQNIKNSAPGIVSVLKMLNEVGEHVRAGKNRRTALIGILSVTHPDIVEFLDVKLDKKELNNFNISVAITDRFIDAVEFNEDWFFVFNNKKYYVHVLERIIEGKSTEDYIKIPAVSEEDAIERAKQHYKKNWDDDFKFVGLYDLKAREIWNYIWEHSVKSGDPGIFNIDQANNHTNVTYFEHLPGSNPCGEIPLPSYGNCCLGHINLSNMVDEFGEVDWKRLANTVRAGVRFLDNVLTINKYPTDECKVVGERSRRIGLGVTGLHYMLIKMGIKYGSEKCLEFLERLFSTIRDEAYKQSMYLARDKGSFPAFEYKKFLSEEFAKTLPARIRMLIKKHGIRNAVMLTIAPTGTISMLMGVSSGVEPIFSAMYLRRYRHANVWKEQVVLDPLFKKWYGEDRSLENFVGAYDISPEDHIKVQATIQKYIDSAISKTINLPEHTQADEFSEVALDYAPYLKGLTVYRAGSKGDEPLQAIPLTQENIQKYLNKEEVEVKVQDGQACSLVGGDCGA